MSRKDTIIIATLVNIALLAILFTTAIHFEEEEVQEPVDLLTQVTNTGSLPLVAQDNEAHSFQIAESDEMDQVLKAYAQNVNESKGKTDDKEKQSLSSYQLVEVEVKKGDYLEKIAKAHNTSVELIKKVNGLYDHRIAVGQVLKVPVNTASEEKLFSSKSDEDVSEPEPKYYTIKSGDNPWKIARKFHVKFEELLRLNDLDENTARKLQVGDKIRVR